MSKTTPMTVYYIEIQGHLKGKWAAWFNSMNGRMINLEKDLNGTTLVLAVPDQAALRGLLNKLWDLNLTLISVIRQESSGECNENQLYPSPG